MKTVLIYLLQVVTCSGILYVYYHLFLRNKKFHQYNRYYLLLAVVISTIIPFLQIPVYFDSEESKPLLVKTLTVFSAGGFEDEVVINSYAAISTWFNWKNILSLLYVLTGVFLFARFWLALLRVIRMTRLYPGEKIDNIRFIKTDEPATPFSFFRWLFWNNKIELDSDNGQQIFRHELFHIRQKHSWDIILFEILTIFFWINPFFHLIKKEIKAIHEFLADKHAVEENKEWDYAELLLMQVLGSPNTRLTNPFFHNQIKRRIAMLTTSKKPGYQYLRKIMVLPLAAIIIGMFAFTYKNKFNNPAAWQGEPFTIVIDAGHGGNDPGARSPGNEYKEAELTLEIAKTIKTLAKEYNIDVVLTRENEKFPGGAADKDEALRKRIEIIGKVNPTAFISIHISTTAENNQNNYSGFEAFVSKKEDVSSIRLASAVLENLSALYTTREEARIRQTEGIYVLDKNNSPAILLNCGYINNVGDLAFIKDKINQEKIARSVLQGVVNYKSQSFQKKETTLSGDTIPSKISKQPAFIIHSEEMIVHADTIVYHPQSTTGDLKVKESLVIINGQKQEPGILDKKTTIIADEVHMYPKGDKEAIRLYGKDASDGLLVFNNARIIDQSPRDTLKPNNELVVVGYSTKKSRSLEEVEVKGKPIEKKQTPVKKNSNSLQEVEVIGKPIPGKEIKTDKDIDPLKEKVVVGKPLHNIVFEKVEKDPSFPGGKPAWSKFLEKNANPSIPVDNGAPEGVYSVIVQYIVNADGSLTDIKALTKFGYGMEEEAMRIITKSPKWIPAEQNGKKVNAYRKQPITFLVEEEKENKAPDQKIPPITLNDLKKSTPQSLLKLAADVEITSYTFSMGDADKITEVVNKGNDYNASTVNLINRAVLGNIIVFETIVGTKNAKQTKFPALIYRVI